MPWRTPTGRRWTTCLLLLCAAVCCGPSPAYGDDADQNPLGNLAANPAESGQNLAGGHARRPPDCPPDLVCLTPAEAREATAVLVECEGDLAAAEESTPCPDREPTWWAPTAARVAWAGAWAVAALLVVVVLR